jgi:hypothetical protein
VDEILIQTRWKDRDGEPRMVEASHLESATRTAEATEEPADEGGGA